MDDTMTDTWPPYTTAQGGTELLEKKTTQKQTKKQTSNSCICCTLLEKTGLEYKSALKQTTRVPNPNTYSEKCQG